MERRHFLKLMGTTAVGVVLPANATIPEVQDVIFPATTDWGTITHTAIVDNSGSWEEKFMSSIMEDAFSHDDLHIALFTSELDAEGIGEEVSYNGYERQPIEFNFATEDGGITNPSDVVFPETDEDLTIRSMGVYKGENMVFYENFEAEQGSEDLTLKKGDLTINME